VTNYLIAVVNTDRKPDGEFRDGEIIPGAEVRPYLYALLDRHGRAVVANAPMLQEARAAEGKLSRWDGHPARFCGFLLRYDLYPIPDLSRDHGAGLATEVMDSLSARERMFVAFGAVGALDVPKALAMLKSRGVPVDQSTAYQIRKALTAGDQ